ncbi:MAG: sigma-70 family RNA polymerase sigma factor [candidate division Zixibacteria bacterium]|nr:sigma-70 family RNA polymerase sigma factor [candidate division Zixibacteria bacterium]
MFPAKNIVYDVTSRSFVCHTYRASQTADVRLTGRIAIFNRVYNELYRPIFRFANRMLADPEDARDVCQEVFTRLYRALESGASVDNPRAWLFKAAANDCINRLRRQKRFGRIAERLTVESVGVGQPVDLDQQENLRIMRETIEQLPSRDRTLLVLYQDEISYAEMAEIVGVNPNSVGKMLARAIDRLSREVAQRMDV